MNKPTCYDRNLSKKVARGCRLSLSVIAWQAQMYTCHKLASLFLFPVENNFASKNVSLSVMSVIFKFNEILAVG